MLYGDYFVLDRKRRKIHGRGGWIEFVGLLLSIGGVEHFKSHPIGRDNQNSLKAIYSAKNPAATCT